MEFDWQGEAPAGYAEAVAKERTARELSFVTTPEGEFITEFIGEFEVMQLTLAHWSRLRLVRSPFLQAELPSTGDIAQFMWILSPIRKESERKRIYRRCSQLFDMPMPPKIHWKSLMDKWEKRTLAALDRYNTIINDIYFYVGETFMDSPGGKHAQGKAYVCSDASMVDTISYSYGWDFERINNFPLRGLFQLLKLCNARETAKAGRRPVLINPSDKVLADDARREHEALKAKEGNKDN